MHEKQLDPSNFSSGTLLKKLAQRGVGLTGCKACQRGSSLSPLGPVTTTSQQLRSRFGAWHSNPRLFSKLRTVQIVLKIVQLYLYYPSPFITSTTVICEIVKQKNSRWLYVKAIYKTQNVRYKQRYQNTCQKRRANLFLSGIIASTGRIYVRFSCSEYICRFSYEISNNNLKTSPSGGLKPWSLGSSNSEIKKNKAMSPWIFIKHLCALKISSNWWNGRYWSEACNSVVENQWSRLPLCQLPP